MTYIGTPHPDGGFVGPLGIHWNARSGCDCPYCRDYGLDQAWLWSQVAQAALQKQVTAWQDLQASKQRSHNEETGNRQRRPRVVGGPMRHILSIAVLMLVQYGGSGPNGMGGSGAYGTGGSWPRPAYRPYYQAPAYVPSPGIRPIPEIAPLGTSHCTQQFVVGVGWQQVCW